MSLIPEPQRGSVSHLVNLIGTNAEITLPLVRRILYGKHGSHFVRLEATDHIKP